MNRKLRFELALIAGSMAATGWLTGKITKQRQPDANPRAANPSASRRAWGLIGLGALALLALPSRRESFAGKSVVITGGSRGLGLVMARQLLSEGAKVTILARDPEELERAKHQLSAISSDVFTVICDVGDPEHLDLAFAEARARFGAIDALINNAGVISVGPWETLDDADFQAQMKVHLDGPMHAIRLVRPFMHMQGGGRIINISSIGGKIPVPHMSAYSTSKFALGGFSESLRPELRAENILVTTAYPGLMRTGSPVQAVFKGDQEKEFAWFALGDNTPGLSISAETAARRILNASREGRAEVVVSLPAKLGAIGHELFSETFACIMNWTARALPTGSSQQRKTGAASLGFLQRISWTKPFRWIARRAAEFNNEALKYDPEMNLGLKSKYERAQGPAQGDEPARI